MCYACSTQQCTGAGRVTHSTWHSLKTVAFAQQRWSPSGLQSHSCLLMIRFKSSHSASVQSTLTQSAQLFASAFHRCETSRSVAQSGRCRPDLKTFSSTSPERSCTRHRWPLRIHRCRTAAMPIATEHLHCLGQVCRLTSALIPPAAMEASSPSSSLWKAVSLSSRSLL